MNESSKIAAAWWAAQVRCSNSAHVESLTVALEQACNECLANVGECHLAVDWNPDGTLRDVCNALATSLSAKYTFPQKTSTHVTADSVVVKQDRKYQRLFGEVTWQVVHYDAGGNRTMLYLGTDEVAARSLFNLTHRECKTHKGVDVHLLSDGNILEGDE